MGKISNRAAGTGKPAKHVGALDEDTFRDLVEANRKYVVLVARQYLNKGKSLGELVAAGNVGLEKAAHRFDPDRGFRFISYAVWWIRQSILQALSDQSES